MGYREYAKDFEIEYVTRPGKKRPKAVRVYVGPYFQFKAAPDRIQKLKKRYLACLLAAAALLLIPMCVDCAFTRTWYIQTPAAAAWIPWLLASNSVWRLWTAKENMEREHADLIHDRMSSSTLFLMGFFGISCIGCTMQMGSLEPAGTDWLVSICYVAGLLCSCAMFAGRKELEMRRVENPEKPQAHKTL